jgi:hypothetical protein
MKNLLPALLLLITNALALAQYPFDKFERPDFKSYNDWKFIEKKDEKKIHHTMTIPNFFADTAALTIQFTMDESSKQTQNVIRIYKDDKTIQSFRNDVVDYIQFYISRHPVKVADLNGDSLRDLKITYDYNSNGLALRYRSMYLIQNENRSFTKYSFDNQYEDRIDFERDFDNDGNFEIQQVGLVSQNDHSYWRFSVFKITDRGLIDISDRLDYPLFIQFLKRRNHRQANLRLNKKDAILSSDFDVLTDHGKLLD